MYSSLFLWTFIFTDIHNTLCYWIWAHCVKVKSTILVFWMKCVCLSLSEVVLGWTDRRATVGERKWAGCFLFVIIRTKLHVWVILSAIGGVRKSKKDILCVKKSCICLNGWGKNKYNLFSYSFIFCINYIAITTQIYLFLQFLIANIGNKLSWSSQILHKN